MVRPLKKWDNYSIGSIPMGQEIAVTPLQLITAHAALANGGQLINPHLVLDRDAAPQLNGGREIQGESQPADQDATSERTRLQSDSTTTRIVTRTASEDIVRWLVRGPMTAVVNRGTARLGQIKGVNVFGKTGTAQKVDPKTGKYSETDFVCSYVSGAPSEDPEVIVLVIVDSPTVGTSHYGGTVAGPAGQRILERTLISSSRDRTQMAGRPKGVR